MFALFSILYFILIIQTEIKIDAKKIKSINYASFFVSIFFSATMASILAISTVKDIEIPLIETGGYLLVFFSYWLVFTFTIWAALRVKQPQA